MITLKLTEKIENYIQTRGKNKLEVFDKKALQERGRFSENSAELEKLEAELLIERAGIVAKFQPNAWLNSAAKRAKQINLVTHALKFIHTEAKGSSIYCVQALDETALEACYLSTANLKQPEIDVVGNAAALDVASLLQLQSNGVSLISLLAKGEASSLRPFAEDDEQLEQWLTGFKKVLQSDVCSSHTLAKQLYFPVPTDGYHLLAPLYASSFLQALNNRITDSRFSEEAKEARKAKREERYTDVLVTNYPNVAVQTFGGTKPQNVSQLNSKRGGKAFLLSCQPPIWRRQQRPPKNFWYEYDRRAWRCANSLASFLGKVKDKTNMAIRYKRAELVDRLIHLLLDYAAEIQSLDAHVGWSADSSLSQKEKLWLDPYRNDLAFQVERKETDWQEDIAEKFAAWLNHKLAKQKLSVGDSEYKEWVKLAKQQLMLNGEAVS
jgi:CRISPR-associated protein Csy1